MTGCDSSLKSAISNLLSLRWDDDAGQLMLLDQRILPVAVTYLPYTTIEGVEDAIRTMVVRGAPAIGVAAAYGVYLGARGLPDTPDVFFSLLAKKSEALSHARPTAVNLSWAVRRMMRHARAQEGRDIPRVKAALLEEAKRIHAEDESICRRIGESLLPRLWPGMGILTHCNAGQLATSRYGTALSPIYLALEAGMPLRIYADETRPRLQGATLTALELAAVKADVTVLCDNMAATVMAQGKIDCCIVGCDRVAANGDTANKIGTLGVAVLARHYDIPFYVAAPTPTIDMACPDGACIPIEERDAQEVTCRFGARTVPEGVKVYNPAFDVTPHALIDGFATEQGLILPPFENAFQQICSG